MATLVSPGVAVSVSDQSQYGASGQGTVPMIIMATHSNKTNISGSGYASGTTPMNAGKATLLTSQRELIEIFGRPEFKVVDGTPVHAAETNEYGLMAAYSYLGLANRAYVLRADIDLGQLEHSATEPAGAPANGTYWLDLAATSWGIFEAVGGKWVAKTPRVITDVADTVGSLGLVPATAFGANDDYALVATNAVANYQVYKKVSGAWVIVSSAGFTAATITAVVNVAPHYQVPVIVNPGDVWLKTTTPNHGLNVAVKKYTAANVPKASPWVAQTIVSYETDTEATAGFGKTLMIGKIYAKVSGTIANVELRVYNGTSWNLLSEAASTMAPTGMPTNGTLWYNTDLIADLYVKANGLWTPVDGTVTIDASAPESPSTNDIWVDSSDIENYPMIHVYDGSTWIARDTADQTTPAGVVFADLTSKAADASNQGGATPVDEQAPDPELFPNGILLWNSIISTGNVKRYDAATDVWNTYSGNMEDGRPWTLRKAQRRAVVRAMQEAVNSSTEIREEMTFFTLIAAPGYTELYDEMVQLNTDRKETAFIIVDTPFRLSPSPANKLIDWMTGNNAIVNGEDGIIPTGAGHTAAAYYPSAITSDLSGNDVVVPPSHIVLRTMAYNDQVAYPWFAPAGLTRGVVTNATNVGYVNGEGEFIPLALTNGQRDTLYGDGSRVGINPIARFPGQGVFVFGQRTLQSFASALDRVNVARLIAYLRERFDPLARPFIFEPNDQITRSNARQVFVGFLNDLLSKRALYDFIVVCDETNNTPARIDRNELWIDIAIEPVKAAEFIYIPIRVVNTGELSAK
jgi:phage tail sheath protein FI